MGTTTARGPTLAACHTEVNARFINENQAFRVHLDLRLLKLLARLFDLLIGLALTGMVASLLARDPAAAQAQATRRVAHRHPRLRLQQLIQFRQRRIRVFLH